MGRVDGKIFTPSPHNSPRASLDPDCFLFEAIQCDLWKTCKWALGASLPTNIFGFSLSSYSKWKLFFNTRYIRPEF